MFVWIHQQKCIKHLLAKTNGKQCVTVVMNTLNSLETNLKV